jgi:hypothetical protein
MKLFKKILFISCFFLGFSLHINYVLAAGISADDYYNITSQYNYSQPYEALTALSQAHAEYPYDQRFIDSLNDRSKVILSWSKSSQLKGNFSSAIYGYNTIINTSGVSQIIKDEANVCLILANRKERGISLKLQIPDYFDLAKNSQEQYVNSHYEYQSLDSYNPFGNYLFIENVSSYSDPTTVRFDDKGIPMVNYSGTFYYNPITVEQYALSIYDKYLKDPNAKNNQLRDKFLNIATWLQQHMDKGGAFRYEFYYKHYLDDTTFYPGWVSAMAQGQALSVFARAYHLTGQQNYITDGNAAFKFLTIKTSDGGVMDNLGALNGALKNYIFFQLYVTNPPSYTLNGDMYTLLGLYDWSNLDNNDPISSEAKKYFNSGLRSLKYLLPYYDIGGFVTYDLGYLTKLGIEPTINLSYYGFPLTLLDAFYAITKDETFYYYRKLWTSYIENY